MARQVEAMTSATLITALALPPEARVDRRVPKKLLLEQGAPTAANKRQVNDGIEGLFWVAALKPTTIGVPEYRDTVREYLEIAVLSLALRPCAKGGRLIELVHRAVSYPMWLLTEQESGPNLSLAHKRWSQGEAGKTVLDGELVSVDLDGDFGPRILRAFEKSLAMAEQPRASLYALYQGWIDTVLALQAARITGRFDLPTTASRAAARQEALREFTRLDAQVASLRAAAAKETQIARQVEINLEHARLNAALEAARAQL
jgi:hypothetical protein